MNKEVLEGKKATVKEISKGIEENQSVSIVCYEKLTVAEMTELRHKLAEKGASMTVYKNSMVRRALAEHKVEGLDEILNGANAFVFSKNVQDGPAVLAKFARLHENLILKGAVAEGKALDAKGLKELSRLPGKEGLLAMFCQCLQAPIRQFAFAVKGIAEKEPGNAEVAPAAN